MKAWLAIAVVMLIAICNARAQQAVAPEPVLRVTIDPPRIVVGQKTTLQIDVLAPNYMTAPPELPDFQIRNAVTRPLQNVNLSEQRDGTTYAGVRFEFAIFPQEPGSYAVADQQVRIRYAADPPTAVEIEMLLPRISFEAFIPDAAAGLHPFHAANKLTIEQQVQRTSEQLKTGDAVTRTVILTADGAPAMLLPPQKFVAIEGLALYPAQPSLEDKTDGRTDTLSSTRVDSATYMLQRPGDYSLPAIDVRWWNLASGKIETAHLDAIALRVAADPTQPGGAAIDVGSSRSIPDALFDFVADHWLLTIIALAALAGLMWLAPRAARAITERYRQRRQAYLQSEAWSFEQFRNAARHRSAKAAYFALLGWLQRFEPLAPDHSLETLKAAANDDALDHELGAIERQLFAPDRGTNNWSGAQLLRQVSAARRTLQRQAAHSVPAHSLPQQLNPISGRAAPDHRRRLPAR
jgi:hypothetical protein